MWPARHLSALNGALLTVLAIGTSSCSGHSAAVPTPSSSLVTFHSSVPTLPDSIIGYALETSVPVGPDGTLYGYRGPSGLGISVFVSPRLPVDCGPECLSNNLSSALEDYHDLARASGAYVRRWRELDPIREDSVEIRHLSLDVNEGGESRTWHWLVAPAKGHIIKVFTEDLEEPFRTDEIRRFVRDLVPKLIPQFECVHGPAGADPLFDDYELGTDLHAAGRAVPRITRALLDLGYELKQTPFLIWETKPSFTWPSATVRDRPDLEHLNPGVELWLGVGMQEESPVLVIKATALCSGGTAEVGDVESLIQSAVVAELKRELRRKVGR